MSRLSVKCFQFNMFGENTYLVWDPDSRDAAIIDAGMLYDNEWRKFDAFVKSEGLNIKLLLNTHLHIDHLFGMEGVSKRYGVGLSASVADAFLGERIMDQAVMFGLRQPMGKVTIANPLEDGDEIAIGGETLKVIATPGHSPGGLCFYNEANALLFTGDTLFQYGIGRTDLPGGNYSVLIHSIINRLLTLPDSTTVFPGHGAPTTIATERTDNPFI